MSFFGCHRVAISGSGVGTVTGRCPPQATPPSPGRGRARAAGGGAVTNKSPPTGGPTPPEAETAPDACGGLATAAGMPKGPKQQPPEPEWIGDGEGTSPAGERGGGGNGQGDGGRRGAWVLRMCAGGRGRAHGAVPEPREADGRRA